MSNVKIGVKPIDRKPKGYFVKDLFKVKYSIPRMTVNTE